MAGPGRRGASRGSVTAETALALPAVVLLLGVVVAVAGVGAAQVQAVDAARAGARRAARGDSTDAVVAAARAVGPPGSAVSVSRSGTTVSVSVAASVGVPVPGLPRVVVRARSVADAEEGP